MWEAGCSYFDDAKALICQSITAIDHYEDLIPCYTAKTFHQARACTVQSLLLLGYREFGIGSMEQAWIYIGKDSLISYDARASLMCINRHGHTDGQFQMMILKYPN